jgi:hypothetical protein
MEVEVIGGGAERAVDDAFVLRGDVFERAAHVRRELVTAAAAERHAEGFVLRAARAVAAHGEAIDVLSRHETTFSFSNFGDRAKKKKAGRFPGLFDCMCFAELRGSLPDPSGFRMTRRSF